MSFFLSLINILLQWYIWVPAVAVLAYLTWWNYQKIDIIKDIESVLLVIETPETKTKSETATEQMLTGLHGILRDARELKENKGYQEHISLEITSVKGVIRFYIWTPKSLQSFVESQIYAGYPDAQIRPADSDYVAHERKHSVIHTTELTLAKSEYLPIKTYESFDTDPLSAISSVLAKLEDTNQEIWLQILIRPVRDDWQRSATSWASTIGSGSGFNLFGGGGGARWMAGALGALWSPPEQGGSVTPKQLTVQQTAQVDAVEKKSKKTGYQAKIRIAYLGSSAVEARAQMQNITGAFKQYNDSNLNSFKIANESFTKESLTKYKIRVFADRGYILNIEEIASIFHLPSSQAETPNVVWASTKSAEPPAQLPVLTGNPAIDENISAFGMTSFRGINHQFGMLRYDRSRHVYIIGQTGSGKTGLLELLSLSDLFHGQGYAIIDPHGDFAMNNMRFIPANRLDDVVYFNPADTQYPLGFNPLEVLDPSQINTISSEIIGVLKRMFSDSWGPRLEYILRYTLLALASRPESTMLDITRMLTDKDFRQDTLTYCKDAVVLQFWRVEFDGWSERFQSEAIAPVLNKVGAFTANPIIRNIIGQPKSTFNIREMMDQGKILIVNLNKGLIGEDNASILGALFVTKIQLSAMSRSDIPDIKDRRPFYLYVDEFQNFATDSFATILSEARKYGLNLTVANQYTSQINQTVKNAVFGNVGTIISFRASADDSESLAKQFEPQFEANDLLKMHNRHFVINMSINGERVNAFSAKTLNLPVAQDDNTGRIIQKTRQLYSRAREAVEAEISDRILPPKTQPTSTFPPITPQVISQPSVTTPAPAKEPILRIRHNQPPKNTQTSFTKTSLDNSPIKKKRTRTRTRKPKNQTSNDNGDLIIPEATKPNQPTKQKTTKNPDPTYLSIR